jgi:hypothetical protein
METCSIAHNVKGMPEVEDEAAPDGEKQEPTSELLYPVSKLGQRGS